MAFAPARPSLKQPAGLNFVAGACFALLADEGADWGGEILELLHDAERGARLNEVATRGEPLPPAMLQFRMPGSSVSSQSNSLRSSRP